ncbi:hypothetical protein GBA65_06670 [Rubrobacter marinus]|uniref:Uncharacterized protein n=1 Tax=Rubrobacter marinus TaxID=2653852 RepID=A0A6G8PVP2_9ACTN|nr:hypothetical protein [Rubrobacter marinus]QIN78245.1 hypothetical protein GBA65_06670 [Rubrobacter marinus]
MSGDARSLLALALGCTVAAAIFGFGANLFSFRNVFEETGRAPLVQTAATVVYLALALVLVFKGGWKGVLAAIAMIVCATAVSWALLPLSLGLAGVGDPAGYAERFGEFRRPSYSGWAAFDLFFVGGSAALAQGLRIVANADPRGSRDG